MTDIPPRPSDESDLPLLVTCSTAFAARLPSQRVLDVIASREIAPFAELAQTQPFRLVAFRVLLRDYPEHDPAQLWAHSYDVEVEVEEASPFDGRLPTLGQSFADSGA